MFYKLMDSESLYGLAKIETFHKNNNTIIKRVWIAKKSIKLNDNHVLGKSKNDGNEGNDANVDKFDMIKGKENNHLSFKHWAIILELSNESFVTIQYGKNGISLKEFLKAKTNGENIIDSIGEVWGQISSVVSFCFLGEANYSYENLKKILYEKKNDEKKKINKNEKLDYNVLFNNCQNFVCEIEKILFNKKQFWHSFSYYFDDFFKNFFPNVDLNVLKEKINNKNKNNCLIY